MLLSLGGFFSALNETLASFSLNALFFIVSCIFLFLANRSVRVIGLYTDPDKDLEGNPGSSAEDGLSPKGLDESTAQKEAVLLADFKERCAALAASHDLSSREAEIMEILVRGRTRSFIAEQLVISENTVRWHGKNLYSKLGIHSKQQLLILIEETVV